MTLHLKTLLTPEEMDMIRAIRREYAQATKEMTENRTRETQRTYELVREKRNRVIRSLHEDNFTVREICAILMCSKNYVREAIERV